MLFKKQFLLVIVMTLLNHYRGQNEASASDNKHFSCYEHIQPLEHALYSPYSGY